MKYLSFMIFVYFSGCTDDQLEIGSDVQISKWTSITYNLMVAQGLPSSDDRFQQFAGDVGIYINRDGFISYLSPKVRNGLECTGRREFFSKQIDQSMIEKFDSIISKIEKLENSQQYTCQGCYNCPTEFLMIEKPDERVFITANPSFEPLFGCGPGFILDNPYPEDIVALAIELRQELGRQFESSQEIEPSIPSYIRFAVIDYNQVSFMREPLGEIPIWPIESISLELLAENLGGIDNVSFIQTSLYEEEAAIIWDLCLNEEEKQLDPLHICGSNEYLFFEQDNIVYHVACSADLVDLNQTIFSKYLNDPLKPTSSDSNNPK